MKPICSICLDYLKKSENIESTPCGHIYHPKCLRDWVEKEKNCPDCRKKCLLKDIHPIFINVEPSDEPEINAFHAALSNQLVIKDSIIKLHETEVARLTDVVQKLSKELIVNKTEIASQSKKLDQIQNIEQQKKKIDDLEKYMIERFAEYRKSANKPRTKVKSYQTTAKKDIGAAQNTSTWNCRFCMDSKDKCRHCIQKKVYVSISKPSTSVSTTPTPALPIVLKTSVNERCSKRKLELPRKDLPINVSFVNPSTSMSAAATSSISQQQIAPALGYDEQAKLGAQLFRSDFAQKQQLISSTLGGGNFPVNKNVTSKRYLYDAEHVFEHVNDSNNYVSSFSRYTPSADTDESSD